MTLTKDDFPVGTRVRVIDFGFEDSNPQNGTTGTVVASEPPSSGFVDVRRDGKPADDEFPYRPSELEVIDRATFAVGDRVEYHNDKSPDHPENGRRGEVVAFGSYGPKIKYDDGSRWLEFPFPQNVRHVASEPATPDPATPAAATIARLRTDADALDAKARDARQESNDLQKRVWALEEKAANATRLAAQYRNVANDLEARS